MKIRSGFVSNSSTSSFILVGISNPSKEIVEEFLKKHPAGEDSKWGAGSEVKFMEGVLDGFGDFLGLCFLGSEHGLNRITIDQLQKAVEKVKGALGSDTNVEICHGAEYNG